MSRASTPLETLAGCCARNGAELTVADLRECQKMLREAARDRPVDALNDSWRVELRDVGQNLEERKR